jgi:hypothetical protein
MGYGQTCGRNRFRRQENRFAAAFGRRSTITASPDAPVSVCGNGKKSDRAYRNPFLNMNLTSRHSVGLN